MSQVAIAGAGAFGTALAIALARKGAPVLLWARRAEQADAMRRSGQNSACLPGVSLPKLVTPSSDFAPAAAAEILLVAVPMQSLGGFMSEHGRAIRSRAVVACCKGVDLATGHGPTRLIATARPDLITAILTGPSFAVDIARGLPTALTLACADPAAGAALQTALSAPGLRLYRTSDVTGAELGGALKNVIAIAAGMVIGAGLGESARAALMTRGYAEMVRLAVALGGRAQTLAGLSGFGDLVLTCASAKSRNFSFGLALGRNEARRGTLTVEGRATARAVVALARQLGIDMPITTMVSAVIDGSVSIAEAADTLLSRPLKEE